MNKLEKKIRIRRRIKNYKKIKYHGFTNLDLYNCWGNICPLHGIATSAGSTKEFYVAGGEISPWQTEWPGADWMSAASFISMAGIISLMAMMVLFI
jgi:Na+(H+)/acetate symporter ActP